MSLTPSPEPAPDADPAGSTGRPDQRAASVAWAVAAVVVALAAAFITWLAMGDQGGSERTAGDRGDAGPGGLAEQTAPPEVEEVMLSLQRRDAEDLMAVGAVDAPVVMIEYADYRCPFCAQFHQGSRPGLQPLVDDGTLRIEFRDLVLFEEASLLAAVAGRAAAEQDLLAPFQAEVFALSLEEAADYDRDDLVQVAEQVGVPDLDAFRADLDDEALLAAVQADTAEARAVGIGSTPTFLINTQVVQGTYPAEQFVEVIEAEAAKVERTGAG